MHPVLHTLHVGAVDRPIGAYGLCLALAILLAAGLTLRACVREGLDAGAIIASIGTAIASGFVGAYALFVIVALAHGSAWLDALVRPGLVFYGGALGALVGFVLAARALGAPALLALDLAAPALPLAHALGRLGCFLGGCCFGAPCDLPWAVTYTHPLAPAAAHAVARHPWPLYEAGASLLLALVLQRLPRARLREGERIALYLAAYGGIRLALEPLRDDAIRGFAFAGALSTSQLVALCTIAVAAGFVIVRRSKLRSSALFLGPSGRCT